MSVVRPWPMWECVVLDWSLYAAGVGYDIDFRSQTTDYEGGDPVDELPPLALSAVQEACWRRIVARVRAEIGAALVDSYPTHLELWLEQPAIQVWYAQDVVTLEMPYWYTASKTQALTATRVLYALAGIVQAETGMLAIDPQIGQPVSVDHLERAAARYRGVGEYVRAVEAEPPERT